MKLIIKNNDYILQRLTGLSSNFDDDKLVPAIIVAQNTEIKRLLGKELYDEILESVDTDIWTDRNKELYDDYLIYTICYWTMYHAIKQNEVMVANAGNVKHSGTDYAQANEPDNVKKSNYYRSLALSSENEVNLFLKKESGCKGTKGGSNQLFVI